MKLYLSKISKFLFLNALQLCILFGLLTFFMRESLINLFQTKRVSGYTIIRLVSLMRFYVWCCIRSVYFYQLRKVASKCSCDPATGCSIFMNINRIILWYASMIQQLNDKKTIKRGQTGLYSMFI